MGFECLNCGHDITDRQCYCPLDSEYYSILENTDDNAIPYSENVRIIHFLYINLIKYKLM